MNGRVGRSALMVGAGVLLGGLVCGLGSMQASAAEPKVVACRVGVVEGEVRAGEAFVRPVGNGLEVMLEPLVSGWVLRVVPATGARGAHDYAELATPPYKSVSPLLISTDYSFRAQDAVGWNPRHFRFAADAAEFHKLLGVYEQYERAMAGGKDAGSPAMAENRLAENRLVKAVGEAPAGVFEIEDSHLVAGTADQAAAAAAVALHPNLAAHTMEQPENGRPSALGKVTWMRFRIQLELPMGFRAERSLAMERGRCP